MQIGGKIPLRIRKGKERQVQGGFSKTLGSFYNRRKPRREKREAEK